MSAGVVPLLGRAQRVFEALADQQAVLPHLHRAEAPAAAFDRVYREHATGLYRFCLSQLRDPALAEDVAAEAMTAAWGAWQRVSPDPDGIRPWLFRIARNAVVDAARRRQRGRSAVARLGARTETWATPEATAAVRAELRAAVDAIALLPARQRQLIGLRIAAALPYAEVAAVVGMSEQAAKVATLRALARVRTQITKETGP